MILNNILILDINDIFMRSWGKISILTIIYSWGRHEAETGCLLKHSSSLNKNVVGVIYYYDDDFPF